jgi:fatty acid CoA ligase FadD9
MTNEASQDIEDYAGFDGTPDERRERRIAELYANDPQFKAAQPITELGDATRSPGLRLAPLLWSLVAGYGDRPALGQRSRELVTDPATGRTSTRLLPTFDSLSDRSGH